ncbi:MAG: hypothetical protein KYX62_11520 [Pseudomonadota bacterium]|nr:hypothetical protein [Pseudomonadota bacterium]
MRYLLLFRSAVLTLLCAAASVALADKESGEEGSWVEENINPRTEWIEHKMTPFNRWVEKAIQGEPQPDGPGPFRSEIHSSRLPANVIPPQEAARLAELLHKCRVLKVSFYPATPPYYQVRLLSRGGSISHIYLNALDGTLLDGVPSAVDTENGIQREESDESADR